MSITAYHIPMSTISANYTVPLYSLFQAGQGSSVSSQGGSSSGAQSTPVSSQTANNLTNLGSALQAGNLSDAQTALIAVQSGLTDEGASDVNPAPTTTVTTDSGSDDSNTDSPSGPFTNNQQANADYQSMVLNLGQGKIAAAAKDYAQLQTDLKLHQQHHSGVVHLTVNTNSSADETAGSVFSVTV